MMCETLKKRAKGLLCLVLMLLVGMTTAQGQTDSTKIAENTPYLQWINRSYDLGNEGRYEEAIKALDSALKAEPNNRLNPVLLNNMAGLYQLLGDQEKAIVIYNAAVKKQPDNQTIRHNRALLFGKMKRDKEAITDYTLLIGMASQNEVYLYQRAMLYLANNQYDEAKKDLERLLNINNNSLKARLGYAMLQTITKQYDEAERLYDYVISKIPKNPEPYAGRARLFLAKGMTGYALRDINRAFELADKKPTPEMYVIRGEVNMALKDAKAAQQDFEQARRLDPAIVCPSTAMPAKKPTR